MKGRDEGRRVSIALRLRATTATATTTTTTTTQARRSNARRRHFVHVRRPVRKLGVSRLFRERFRFELRSLFVPRQRVLGEPPVADKDAGAARHRQLARLPHINHNAELLPHQILRFLDLIEIDLYVSNFNDDLVFRRCRRRSSGLLPRTAACGGGSSHESFQDVVPFHPPLERADADGEFPARVTVCVHNE